MRYHSQELFIGKQAQKALQRSKVTIVGIGALGSVVAELLARAGLNLTLIDRDTVEETNLQRQVLFSESDKGKPKTLAAKKKLEEINPKITIKTEFIHLDYENIRLVNGDVIVDCTDNLETRYLLNEYAVKKNIPLVHGSAIQDHGFVFNVIQQPCLRCIFKNAITTDTCETVGVMNTITCIIGALQAQETIKILTKKNPERDLLYVTLTTNSITKIKVKPEPSCSVCKGKYDYLEGKNKHIESYCGAFIFKEKINYNRLKKQLKQIGAKEVQNTLIFKKITIFPHAVLIKTQSKKEAQTIYSKYIGN